MAGGRVLPLIAFPLLYNSVFLVGTMNYLFGIGLSLWRWQRGRRARARNGAASRHIDVVRAGAVFCHLFSVRVYALGLFAFELQRLGALRGRRPLSFLFERRADGRRRRSSISSHAGCRSCR